MIYYFVLNADLNPYLQQAKQMGPLKRGQEKLKKTYGLGSFSRSFFLHLHRLGYLG